MGVSSCGQKRRTSYPARTTVTFKNIYAKKRHTSVSSAKKSICIEFDPKSGQKRHTSEISDSKTFGKVGKDTFFKVKHQQVRLDPHCTYCVSAVSAFSFLCVPIAGRNAYIRKTVEGTPSGVFRLPTSSLLSTDYAPAKFARPVPCPPHSDASANPATSQGPHVDLIKSSRQSLGGSSVRPRHRRSLSRDRDNCVSCSTVIIPPVSHFEGSIPVGRLAVYSMAKRGQKSHTSDLQKNAGKELRKHIVEMSNCAICEI